MVRVKTKLSIFVGLQLIGESAPQNRKSCSCSVDVGKTHYTLVKLKSLNIETINIEFTDIPIETYHTTLINVRCFEGFFYTNTFSQFISFK